MDHARQKKIEGQGKDAIFALRGCFGIQKAFTSSVAEPVLNLIQCSCQLDVSTQDGKGERERR